MHTSQGIDVLVISGRAAIGQRRGRHDGGQQAENDQQGEEWTRP
jgi:hypothetical protein